MSITEGAADGPFNSINEKQDTKAFMTEDEIVDYFHRADTIEGALDKIDFITNDLEHMHSSLRVLLNKVANFQRMLPNIKKTMQEHIENQNPKCEPPPELEILDKIYKEFPQLLIPDTERGFKFSLTGLPLVKEDYETIRKFFLKEVPETRGTVKFYGIEKVGKGSFNLNYVFNPKGIPEKALDKLPPTWNFDPFAATVTLPVRVPAPKELPYFRTAKVGDKANDAKWGNGNIYEINHSRMYPIIVDFNDGEKGHHEYYSLHGVPPDRTFQTLFYIK